jgi:hypothetical protein
MNAETACASAQQKGSKGKHTRVTMISIFIIQERMAVAEALDAPASSAKGLAG